MSKAQWQSETFLTRTGSHSMTGKRGIALEFEPARAALAKYRELRQRAKESSIELRKIDQQLVVLRGQEKKRLGRRKKALQAEQSALRKLQQLEYLPSFAEAFLVAARTILDDKTLQEIETLVMINIDRPPRHWNAFLAEEGFGWCDRQFSNIDHE